MTFWQTWWVTLLANACLAVVLVAISGAGLLFVKWRFHRRLARRVEEMKRDRESDR